jgi:hypothetical protein
MLLRWFAPISVHSTSRLPWVHVGPGCPQADAIHSGLLKDRSSVRMEILRCSAPHQTMPSERYPHVF